MNRNHVSIAFGVTFLALGALVALGGGCTCAAPQWNWSFGDFDTVTVDGVELPHKATLRFSSADKPARIALTFQSASIRVEGDPSVTGIEAEYEVREKTPGDVSLAASPDGVVAKSASGSPLLVVSAKLRVPKATPVKIATSLGRATIVGISDVAEAAATSDAGRVELSGLKNVARVFGRTNLGSVSLTDAAGCADVTLETDAGSVRATDVQAGQGRLKSDLGEVRAERCTFDRVYAHTDLGGVRLKACTYKSKDAGSNLGSVSETK